MFPAYKPYKMNTADTKEIARAVMSSLTKHVPDDEYLNRQKGKLEEADADIELLQSRDRANSLTDDLKSIDDERDDITIAMESEVESKIRLKKFNPAKGEAAEALQAAFDLTPIKISAGYATQTNQTVTRIRHCNTPELRTHFETLEMLTIWDRFIEVQAEFEKASDEKDALESVKLRGTVKAQTDRIKDVMKFILPYLEAQSLDVAGAYDAAAKEVLEAITRVMTVAEARHTRKLNAAAE